MMKNDALEDLKARFGNRISTSSAERDRHGRDESSHTPALPDAVFYPKTREEVAEAVRLCAQYGLPIIPFGAGTSLEGHVMAPRGGLTIDLTHMNKILAVNSADMDVRVEAGITRQALNAYLRDHGLFFPVDPGADCTLGGMVATRASGTNAVRYGTMREQLLSLQVVTASGDIVETGTRARKSAAGYDLTHLFAGSEGTLGIITEISLRVFGRPAKLASGVCHFPTLKAAIDTVIATIQLGIPVARIELLDELSIRAVNAYSKMNHPETPMLFLEFHGSDAAVDADVQTFSELAHDAGGSAVEFATRQEDINRLWQARHQLYYATRAMMPDAHVMTTDVCVPISRLGDCMLETRQDIDACPITGTMLGHVGDGNFHTILLANSDRKDEMAALHALHDRMVRRAIKMGGTCTGEHGIGQGKKEFLALEKGPAVGLMQQIKTAFDPQGIMNPDKLLPDMEEAS